MIRMAVIGAGRWGCMHASKVALHPLVALTAIVDLKLTRAAEAAQMYGAAGAFRTVEDALPYFDACIIAVPIRMLSTVAAQVLMAGKHVLIEKPGAMNLGALKIVMEAQRASGTVAAVGFLERFNVNADLAPGRIRSLALWRSAPSGPRFGTLALDWSCHDVDLAYWLTGTRLKVGRVDSVTEHSLRFRLEDQGVCARINTRTGSSRVRRKVWADGLRIDLLDSRVDALHEQMTSFVAAINGHGYGRLADLSDALKTLSALDTLARLSEGQKGRHGQYPLPV